jgi:23S rRNA pseudouridine2604 synthase
VKIDKFIALTGFTSRRKACDLIAEKRVQVNGRTATFSTKADYWDELSIDGKVIEVKPFEPVYLVYNKPRGIICTTEPVNGNITEALDYPEKVYPIGRLDKNSEGLLLLTNHGEVIDKIANAAHGHEKEYIVTLNLPVRKKFLEEISAGVKLGDEQTKPCKAWPEPGTRRVFRIVLTQGLNRQIRRMCTMFDYQVIKLQRVRVMNISLGALKPGTYRLLTVKETDLLFDQLG